MKKLNYLKTFETYSNKANEFAKKYMNVLKNKLDKADILYEEIDELTIKNHKNSNYPFYITYIVDVDNFEDGNDWFGHFYDFHHGSDENDNYSDGQSTNDVDMIVEIIKREKPLSAEELINKSLT